MTFRTLKTLLIILLCITCISQLYAQEKKPDSHKHTIRVGLNYGQATQERFPFNNPNYLYENKYFKAQFNYLLKQTKRFGFELRVEPGVYKSQHQLLNLYFIQPDSGPNYQEQRDLYTKMTSFYEYALNIGIITKFIIIHPLSVYVLGSSGPMISDMGTERLRKGFAFSDIIGMGLNYKIERVIFDLRFTLRHNSNANLYEPNSGHNSVGAETGVSFQL